MLVMTATQQCKLTFEVFDAKGNPATVDGIPDWSSSDETKVTVTAEADGMSSTIKAVGPATTQNVQVSVQVDADLGAGVKPIVGILEVQIIGGEATVVNITAGTPEEQPV